MRGGGGTPEALRRSLAVLILCAALALTGCKAKDGAAPSVDDGTPSASATPVTPAPGASAAAPGTAPAAKPSKAAKPTLAGGSATMRAVEKPKPPAPSTTSTCDHKMPISPDEIAVYRYTPEGGFHSLIVKHGNWGCGAPDTDGAPFETVGVETFIPIAEDAKITAVTPIVESTENEKVTLQQLIDWLVSHPDQGLVFRYHLGPGAEIDTLDQVFTP
ncbi:hypothetical protein GCM10009730_44730 [Streptomyces albidochromogenes]|uniref:hypothetical protein n=1 Tax=Streptomyces albidochromogenes TaxID=329524 RepID=UPI00110FC1F1|nr:hypothetical protein [Streptomyces albidochromogenes]